MLDEPTLDAASRDVPDALVEHLRRWLGTWPPTSAIEVVGAPQRTQPGWDGRVRPVLGVADASGATVLSVPPEVADAAREVAESGTQTLLSELPELLGARGRTVFRAVFRWSADPADGPDAGQWVPADGPDVPEWLHPFGGDVLVATSDDGTHLAGVGIKRHDPSGRELAVVTAAEARGRGLGRALVAQAARHVLRSGAVPTYLHATDNIASARLADSAGFPDRGWTVLGMGD